MADEKVILELELQLDDGSFKKVQANMLGKSKKAGKAAGKGFAGAFDSFIGNVGAVAFTSALSAIKGQIGGIINAAEKLEVFETQFKTILGSTQAAQKQLKDLQNFAATTPFQLEGLALSTRQLLSFGVAQEDVIGTLTQLGDIAAGTGATISDFAIPFGRLISTQKLTLQELDKFSDRGVNLYKELADQTGVSLKDIRTNISNGKVDFEEFTKAISKLTSKGGTFFKGAEAQSKTLAGIFSTFKDNFFNLQGELGNTFSGVLKAVVSDATVLLQKLTKLFQDNSAEITQTLITLGRDINTYVIFPIEQIGRGFIFAVNLAKTALANLVDIAAGAGLAIAKALNLGGKLDGFIAELEIVKEATSETAAEMGDDLNKALEAFGTDSFSEKADAYLLGLQETIDASNAIVSTAEPLNPFPSQEKIDDSVESLNLGFARMKIGFDDSAETMKKTATQLASTFKSKLVSGIVGGIQTITGAIRNGENAFSAFGKAVLATFGDMATQLGAVLIGAGLGVEALKSLQGAAAVAAGIGLIAVGSVISSLAGSSSSGASADYESGTASSSLIGSSATETADEELEDRAPTINVNISGDVLDSETSGLRIVELINQATDAENVTINRNALA